MTMHRWRSIVVSGLLASVVMACGPSDEGQGVAPDSAELEHAAALTLLAEAEALRDSARAVLATLLDDPASATFDSLVVLQPPVQDGRQPALVACGRIGGSPGIGGRRDRVRFVYQGRWTVFTEDASNAEEFAALWARTCGDEGATVVVGDAGA